METNNPVKLEQLKLLYGSLISSQIGMFLAGCMLIYILKDTIATEILALWLSFLSLTIVYRLIIRHIFFFQLKQGNLDVNKSYLRFLHGVIISGLVWGSSSVFLYPRDSDVLQAYLGLILLGIVAASVGTLSPKKSAFSSFILMTFIPLIVQEIISPDLLSYTFALLLSLFLSISYISALRLNKYIISSIKLKCQADKRTLELYNQENKYKFLFEKSEDPMLLISDYRLVLANQAAVKLLGYQSLEHLLTASQFDLSPNTQPDGTPSNIAAIQITQELKDMGFVRSEWLYKRLDGREKPSEVTSTIVPFEGRKAVYCIIRDISKIKETENELIVAKQKSEIASRSKSQFLANMSHEIRTPMNGVIGATNLMLQHELSIDQKKRAVTIKKSAESMLSILNNILDFSKIEAGKLELETIEFELNQFIQDFSTIVSNRIEAKGIRFKKPEEISQTVWLKGDIGRIKQILINLMDNAIKFTDSGEISLSYNISELKNNKIIMKFNILDTGIGINFEQQNLLFERFTQADSSTTREYGGTGLGLSICKELSKLMGGDIGFISKEGKGSEFWFTIEVSKTTRETNSENYDKIHIRDLQKFKAKVLIVDDNQTNLEVAEGMLELFGLNADLATNGLVALKLLEKNHYDLIFMDCQMPIMDGYEATKKIRENQSNSNYKDVSVIAMTANAMKGDREICLDSGMDDYITKPFSLDTLQNILIKWVPKSKQQITSISSPFNSILTMHKNKTDEWFDYHFMSKELSGNQQLIQKIAKNFTPNLSNDVNQLIQEINQHNQSEIIFLVHRIKGASATFGCQKLSKLMYEIEVTLKKENMSNLLHLKKQINEYTEKTINAINTAIHDSH